MKKQIILLLTIFILGSSALAQAEFVPTHFIVGKVEAPNEIVLAAAQGQPIQLHHEGNKANYAQDLIGIAGKSNQAHYFLFNAYEAPPLGSWQPGDKLLLFVPPFEVEGTTYAGILTIEATTAAGVDFLTKPVVLVKASTFLPEENPKISISLEGPLDFSIEQNNPQPVTKSFTLTNSGKGSLSPLLQIDPEASWLSAGPIEKTLGAGKSTEIAVTASGAGLEPGIYQTNLTLKDAASAQVEPVTILVVLIITAADSSQPLISISPASLDFTAAEGGDNPAPQEVIVANIGSGTLKPVFAKKENWLNIDTLSKELKSGEFAKSSVSCQVAGLKANLYSDSIQISDKDNPKVAAKELPVSLILLQKEETQKPVIAVLPSSLSFTAAKDGAAPPSQNLEAANIGKGSLNLKISPQDSWVSVFPASATLPEAEKQSFSVSITSTQLDPGKHKTLLTLSDSVNPKVEILTVEVSFTLTDPNAALPIIDLLPQQLNFAAQLNGAVTESQILEITNAGSGMLKPSILKENTSAWPSLSFDPDKELKAAESLPLKINCSPANLGPDIYSENLIVSDAQNAGVESKKAKIIFIVNDPDATKPILAVEPSSLSFSAVKGVSEPTPQNIVIANVGKGFLNYTVSEINKLKWISASPSSGSIGPAGSAQSAVSMNISDLDAGTHLATLEVKDLSGQNQSKFIKVILNLAKPVEDAEGTIQNLQIKRLADAPGSGLEVSWQTEPPGLIADVYALTGAFDEDSPDWQKIAGATALTSYTLEDQVAKDPAELYLKVVPTGTALEGLKNFESVGKLNLTVSGEGKYSLVSLPFIPQPGSALNEVIGKQLNAGTLDKAHLIFGWDGTGFSYGAYLSSNGWQAIPNNQSFVVERGKGYFIYSQPTHADKVLTLVGKVSPLPFETELSAGYSLIGNPYPSLKSLDETGFSSSGANKGTLSSADLIFGWDGSGYSLGAYLSSQGWKAIPGNKLPLFEKGKGYFYYVNPANSGFNWQEND